MTNTRDNLRVELSLKSFSPLNTIISKDIVTGAACNSAQVDRNIRNGTPVDRDIWNPSRVFTPEVNVYVFGPSRSSNSSFTKWSSNIEPLDTSVHRSKIQERNSDFLCIEKMGVRSLSDEIVADLDPSIRVNLANSIISKSPRFINFGLLTFDATGKPNIAFPPSTRAKSLNGMQRDNFKVVWLASRHDFERVREMTAYSNHINNSELETREFFERETENIPLIRQTDLVTPLHDNPLTQ